MIAAQRFPAKRSKSRPARSSAALRFVAMAASLLTASLLAAPHAAAQEPAPDAAAALARALKEGDAAIARHDPDACVEALSKALRLSADPLAAGKRAEGARAAEAKAQARIEAIVRGRVRQEVEQVYRRHVDPGVAIIGGGILSLGLTADPGLGFMLGGELSWGSFDNLGFTGALEVQTLLPTRADDLVSGNPFDVTQITAGLVPCVRFKYVSGCAFADVGLLIASGPAGVTFPGGNVLATAGLGPRLAFQIPFADRFMVRAFAALRFSPVDTGWRFNTTSPGTEWGNPPISGLVGLSLSFGSQVRR